MITQKRAKKNRLQGAGNPRPAGGKVLWSQPAGPENDEDDDTPAPTAGAAIIGERIAFQQVPVCGEERPYPPGLFKLLDFLAPQEEQKILDLINAVPWSNDLARRTQQYGYRFDYPTSGILPPERDIPDFLEPIVRRLCAVTDANGEPIFGGPPDNLIVNEYKQGQGIHPHVDRDCFEEPIASISLGSEVQMVWDSDLRRGDAGNVVEGDPQQLRTTAVTVPQLTDTQVGVWLERRCLCVFRGEARYKWSHAIPQRRFDLHNGRTVMRGTRISLTFRRVKPQYRLRPLPTTS